MAEDMNIEESTSVTEGTVDSVHSTNMILEEEEETVTELDTHWKAVNENPRDFTSWTYLLDYVEKGEDIDNARKAFDQFLSRYPYCYGYWKKFAELERRHHDLERCIEVYERGVKAIPLSVELWTAYLDTALDIYHSSEDYESTIKSIYERAIEAAGLEFRSDKLWEHYISWTTNNGHLSAATKIYDQLLQTTTQMYYQNWENFKKHVEDNETRLVIPPEELNERKAAVRRSEKSEPKKSDDSKAKEAEKEAPKVTNGDEDAESKVSASLPNGAEKKEEEEVVEEEEKDAEVEPLNSSEPELKMEMKSEELEEKEKEEKEKEEVMEEEEEEEPKVEPEADLVTAEITLTPAEWKQVKQRFIEDREKVYQKTYEQITKRWYFEEKIRRPYFHVKPLEKSQLDNWRDYLDFEIEQADTRRIMVLFERCLIACALYEEFWVRYATYLESHGSPEQAQTVWSKACTIHLPHCPDLHWRWAAFEESQGNMKAAAEIMGRGQRECASNVQLCTRRLALLRRAKLATAEALCGEFEAAIERFASENTACASLLSLKYARYLCRARGDLEKAERVLREAIARDETNERLYLQLVDLNYTHASSDVSACDRILAWIVSLSVLPRKTRLRFCQRRCELLEESSDDIAQITAALKSLEELKKEAEAAGEADSEAAAKGGATGGAGSDYAGDASEAPPSKRARTAGGTASGASSDPYAAGGTSYEQQAGGYHYSGDGAACEGGAIDQQPHSEAHSHPGGAASSYAAAAAAAAANAAYPGYAAGGGSSWDSYYNSYYGYYAGYYGATGTEHGGDWQMQNASS